jgi:hypothetical protein
MLRIDHLVLVFRAPHLDRLVQPELNLYRIHLLWWDKNRQQWLRLLYDNHLLHHHPNAYYHLLNLRR